MLFQKYENFLCSKEFEKQSLSEGMQKIYLWDRLQPMLLLLNFQRFNTNSH